MARTTTPWWQRVIVSAFRGIRAGVTALLKPARKSEAPTALVQDQGKNQEKNPEIKQEKEELSEDSPKANAHPAPEAAPVVKPPAEIAEEFPSVEPETPESEPEPEAASEIAEETTTPHLPPQAAPAAPQVPDPETPEIEEVEEAFEAEDIEEVMETAEPVAKFPAEETTPQPEQLEAIEEAASEEAPEPEFAHEPSDGRPALPGQAIEETIVTPEIETEATAKQPDLDAASELLVHEESGEASPTEEEAADEPAPVEEAPVEEAQPAELPIAEALGDEAAALESAEAQPEPAQVQPGQLPAKPAPAAPQVPQVVHEPIKREQGPDTSPVSVLVSQVYEGPFDLLLDLIRKQDIDIYNIPIAKITAQFLAYVDKLKVSDMDVAGEFIYTASLLIHIKSKMLLPREPKGLGDEQEDPRRELVERLLEHERFKNAAQMLQQKQMLEAATWTNPGMKEFRDDAGAEAEIAADTTDLVRIFREILDRARNRPVLNLEEDAVTVGQMIQFLGRRLTMEDKPVPLRRLLAHTKSERALIAMFLALLELVRLQAILLRQDRHFSEIFIKKSTGFDAVINEGMARDDWQ